jgi:hypothetical protein
MDERLGFDGGGVRKCDWNGVENSAEFVRRYQRESERKRSPKGREWGEALAAHAIEHPQHPATGAARPLLRTVSAAFWAWRSDYNFHKEFYTIDPTTFEQKPR